MLYKHRVLYVKDISDVRTVVIPGLMKLIRDKSFCQNENDNRSKTSMPYVASCAKILWTLTCDDEQMEITAQNEKIEGLINNLIRRYMMGQDDEEVAAALLRLASVFVGRDSSSNCRVGNESLNKIQVRENCTP